jgi:hypothetical protein
VVVRHVEYAVNRPVKEVVALGVASVVVAGAKWCSWDRNGVENGGAVADVAGVKELAPVDDDYCAMVGEAGY